MYFDSFSNQKFTFSPKIKVQSLKKIKTLQTANDRSAKLSHRMTDLCTYFVFVTRSHENLYSSFPFHDTKVHEILSTDLESLINSRAQVT